MRRGFGLLAPALSLVILTGVLSACSHLGERPAETARAAEIIWPEPPARARIAYVKSFSSSADLGISRGFFGRIFDFFTGRKDWRLVRPMAVLDAGDGRLYVADPGIGAVHLFDTESGRHRLILRKSGRALSSPVGLALGARGEIYIADSFLGQVFVVHAGGNHAEALRLEDSPRQPTDVVFHVPSKRLYVVDAAGHHIKVYAPDGSLLNVIGARGEGDGEFNFPSMIWLDSSERLLVSDALNFRVQLFDLDGRFIKKFGRQGDGTGDMARPKGIATDRDGHVYLVDALFHSLQLFTENGDFLLNVGVRGNGAGEFLLPTGIYVNPDNLIYVCDSRNSRVQVFRYIGNQP